MDYFKSQLDRIQQQLGGLSASQKMLTASLVAIMVMTLLWWGRFAGEAEMTPIFDTSLTASEAGNIERNLRAANIPVSVTGDRVLVPTDRRDEAIAILSIEDALPSESNDAFDAMFAKINPFMPNTQSAAAMLNAKQKSLADILRTFPGVRTARVMLTPKTGSPLRGSPATASVHLEMKKYGDTLGAKEVQGAALLVARAEPGLKPAQVAVLIDGRPQRIKDPDDPASFAMSGEFAEMKAAHERYYEEKIDEKLNYITGRIVSVSARIDNTTTQTQSRKVDAEKSLQKEIKTETGNTETTEPAPLAGEPGVGANTGVGTAIAGASASGSATTTTEKTEFLVVPDETIETKSTPAGAMTIVGASVQLPRSYFVAVVRQLHGNSASEPTETEIAAVAEPMMTDIRNFVMRTCDIADESAVYVSMYNDIVPMLAAAVTEVPEPSPVTATITGHVKEIAVGALAVISLFMLMMMVRKGSSTPLVVPAGEVQIPQNLDTMGELAGIVGDGDPMLDGMELDEDAVKAQHMVSQVQNMVKENPDGAANLVKRWLNRT